MAYAKQTWQNGPNSPTPLSAARLNTMENGISAASSTAELHKGRHAIGGADDISATYVPWANVGATGGVAAFNDTQPRTFPVALLTQETAQSILNNNWTTITYDGEEYDTHAGHSNSANNTRWTVPTGWAGYYWLYQAFMIPANNVGRRGARFLRNGNPIRGDVITGPGPSFHQNVTIGRLVQLNVGDYLEAQGYQESGATQSTFVGATATSVFSIMFVRGM